MSAQRAVRTTAVVLLAALAFGCAAPKPRRAASGPAADAPVPNLFEAQGRITEYITSGRYDADVARVGAAATAWIEERAPKVRRPAIVLDIDETSLSNYEHLADNGFSDASAALATSLFAADAPAIGATLELFEDARDLRVSVFFITGRPGDLQDETEANLREQGYTWTA